MFAHLPRRGFPPRTTALLAAARLRRLAAATCALLTSTAVIPAAWAVNAILNGGTPTEPTVRVVTEGGMAGWQITLIALGAALVAATTAVLLDRARSAHRSASATTS